MIIYARQSENAAFRTFGHSCDSCSQVFVAGPELSFADTRAAAVRCCSKKRRQAEPKPPTDTLAGEWVDVLDGLPNDEEVVLFYDASAPRAQNLGYVRRGTWYSIMGSRRWAPSHWMRLPSPAGRQEVG